MRRSSIEATPPTPSRAGRGRWGRWRTGWRHCCPGWASRRSAALWRIRSSPPFRCWRRTLKGGRDRKSAEKTDTWRCPPPPPPPPSSYLSTACEPPGRSPARSPAGRPRRHTPRSATGGPPGAGRSLSRAESQSKPRPLRHRPENLQLIRQEWHRRWFLERTEQFLRGSASVPSEQFQPKTPDENKRRPPPAAKTASFLGPTHKKDPKNFRDLGRVFCPQQKPFLNIFTDLLEPPGAVVYKELWTDGTKIPSATGLWDGCHDNLQISAVGWWSTVTASGSQDSKIKSVPFPVQWHRIR